MKKIFTLIFTVSFATAFACGVFAESLTLKSVCEGLAERPVTTGDFTQTKTISQNGRQLKSSGKFIISPEGIMWKTEKPFPSALAVTESALIQTAADGTKSVMSGSDNQIFQNIAGTLRSVFAGDSSELEKNFDTKFSESNGTWKVALTPKDSTIGSVMQKLELSGSSSGSGITLLSLEMQETSSNKILYEFSNQKYSKELTADEKANFVAE